jgi:hypothetical protein
MRDENVTKPSALNLILESRRRRVTTSSLILHPSSLLLVLVILCAAIGSAVQPAQDSGRADTLALPAEKHLRNMRQLTFGGENAEAYFSGEGQSLIFQSKRDGRDCDQIYTMRTDGSGTRMVSTGKAARPAPTSFRSATAFFTLRHTGAGRNALRRLTTRAATSGPSTLHMIFTRRARTART